MVPGGHTECETMMITREIKVYAINATVLTGLTAMIRTVAMTVMETVMMMMIKMTQLKRINSRNLMH